MTRYKEKKCYYVKHFDLKFTFWVWCNSVFRVLDFNWTQKGFHLNNEKKEYMLGSRHNDGENKFNIFKFKNKKSWFYR